MKRSIVRWFEHFKKVVPKNTRTSVSIKIEGKKSYVVTFWCYLKTKTLVAKRQGMDLEATVNDAASTLYRLILKDNSKWEAKKKRRMLFVETA